MKVCPTNGLQPLLLSSGLSAMWTPRLVPEIGYCEYNCNLCGKVCPTGAISLLPLRDKQKKKIGVDRINRRVCLPWAKNKECIVCEEHCPLPEKAVKLKREKIGSETVLRPYIDEKICTGCGICQTKCPTRPERAVKIFSFKSDRS
jgi:formate hydrogenlyase subunit 6/NADH:ubiquinone oxidoreductase subunit I